MELEVTKRSLIEYQNRVQGLEMRLVDNNQRLEQEKRSGIST